MAEMDLAPVTAESLSPEQVQDVILAVVSQHRQPSAWELVDFVEGRLGWKARWSIKEAIQKMIALAAPKNAWRNYLESLIRTGDLDQAMKGTDAPKKEIISTIDSLLRNSNVYRHSEQFREMVHFMALFRDYAPYNNMLVRIQNPTCSFCATERDWRQRFGRRLKEDACPMVILAPMHPVMLVYALDATEGVSLSH